MAKEKITKDTVLEEVIENHPDKVKTLMKFGLHCIGCAIAGSETIEEAAEAHNINLKALLKELNE